MDQKPIVIEIPAVNTWTLTQLRYTCKKNKVKGYTKMDRGQLIEAVKTIISDFNSSKETVSYLKE